MSPRLLLALMLMLGLLAWIQPASAGGPTLRKELIHGEWRAPGAPSLPHPASTLAATERPGDFEPWLRFVYAEFGEDKWEIWQAEPFVTQNTRGHERRPIVRNLGNNISPRLSPDLNQILFASDQAGNFDLYRVPYAGGTTQPIFASPSDDFQPVWSPDGNQIAFVSDRDGKDNIYVMNKDGTHVRRLTTGDDYYFSPAWMPMKAPDQDD